MSPASPTLPPGSAPTPADPHPADPHLADPRLAAARAFVAAQGLTDGTLRLAAADAGFRRYLRWHPAQAEAPTRIVMDSPPGLDDPAPFLAVRQRLADAGVRVPTVLAADLAAGFLLLDDLGTETVLQTLAREGFAPPPTARLMDAALATLR